MLRLSDFKKETLERSRRNWRSSCTMDIHCLVISTTQWDEPGKEKPKPLPWICLPKPPTVYVWHRDRELDKVCVFWVFRARVAQLSGEGLCSHCPWYSGLTETSGKNEHVYAKRRKQTTPKEYFQMRHPYFLNNKIKNLLWTEALLRGALKKPPEDPGMRIISRQFSGYFFASWVFYKVEKNHYCSTYFNTLGILGYNHIYKAILL